MKYLSRLFSSAEKVTVIAWRSIFEGTRRLKGLLLRASLIVSLRLHCETGLALISLVRVVLRQVRKSGLLHTALYLKQCSVSLQRYYAGSYTKTDLLSIPVSLTRTGLPVIIPVYIRKVIRRHDDRSDMWVRTYLSWFGIARIIELAPKVSKATFLSIHSPSEDISSVEEVLSVIKSHSQRLVSMYLPSVHSIPLNQGLLWEPTWKATPMSQKFVSQLLAERSGSDIDKADKPTPNIFQDSKLELASFAFNLNKKHSFQDGFFSPGCLWQEWVLYPFDIRRTTEICNMSLEWFERRLGPALSSIMSPYLTSQVPLFTGKLAQTLPGAGKRRIFAICNYVKQRLLFPVHEWAMNVLSTLSTDGTFNQEGPLLRLAEKRPMNTYSFDLKSATDRWPLSIIFTVFAVFFGRTYASAVVNSTLGLNTFRVDYPMTSRMYEIAFQCGQPLGYYGSWSLFALSHHFLVWLAADLAKPSRVSPFWDYAVLGDDVLIADEQVALEYRKLLARCGVQISESKSIISKTGTIEFAKKFRTKGMQVLKSLCLLGIYSQLEHPSVSANYRQSIT